MFFIVVRLIVFFDFNLGFGKLLFKKLINNIYFFSSMLNKVEFIIVDIFVINCIISVYFYMIKVNKFIMFVGILFVLDFNLFMC